MIISMRQVAAETPDLKLLEVTAKQQGVDFQRSTFAQYEFVAGENAFNSAAKSKLSRFARADIAATGALTPSTTSANVVKNTTKPQAPLAKLKAAAPKPKTQTPAEFLAAIPESPQFVGNLITPKQAYLFRPEPTECPEGFVEKPNGYLRERPGTDLVLAQKSSTCIYAKGQLVGRLGEYCQVRQGKWVMLSESFYFTLNWRGGLYYIFPTIRGGDHFCVHFNDELKIMLEKEFAPNRPASYNLFIEDPALADLACLLATVLDRRFYRGDQPADFHAGGQKLFNEKYDPKFIAHVRAL